MIFPASTRTFEENQANAIFLLRYVYVTYTCETQAHHSRYVYANRRIRNSPPNTAHEPPFPYTYTDLRQGTSKGGRIRDRS